MKVAADSLPPSKEAIADLFLELGRRNCVFGVDVRHGDPAGRVRPQVSS